MLRHTFIHLPKVGPGTERRLWSQGVLTWDDLADKPRPKGISAARRDEMLRLLDGDRERLDDVRYWIGALPRNEQWRLFNRFRDSFGYLDIETTGLDPALGATVTLVGIHFNGRFRPFVDGCNMEAAEGALAGMDVVVTFNGASFDLPVLRTCLPWLGLPPGHVDLRHTLARLGYRGGLKRIEVLFGLSRESDISDMDGWEAVRLWHGYQRGDRAALGRLIRYNRADTVNLEVLMEIAYHRLRLELMGEAGLRDEDRPAFL